MKVRVIKTPSFAPGGLYDNGYQLSPGEFAGMATGYGNVAKNMAGATSNFISAISPTTGILMGNDKIQKTLGFQSPNVSGSSSSSSSNPLGSLSSLASTASSLSSLGSLLGGTGGAAAGAAGAAGGAAGLSSLLPLLALEQGGYSPRRRRLSKTMTYADGGNTPTDPQLLHAYHTIANELAAGQDPNALVGQFVDSGMNYDDAQEIVSQVMDFMNPTSEAQMPMAEMGMNMGMFAGQSMEPHIIDKPLMKDGGQTFVTSQPAYTQKSHNYFGTSNAPARDSYVDNDQITTSVKAVPREDATIEAEKGEYILSGKGLYKIQGKKHSQGGTPLAAQGGEFIYSDHRDMSLDPKLQKEANLKVSSSKALADHTPAKVLERNIDTKEFNRLKAIIDNPKTDEVTKKTANFMLEKMQGKLDVIAKLQEAKKQPNPVEIKDQYLEQPEIQEDINEQKQYAYGGLNQYAPGGPTMDPARAAAISQAFGAFNGTPAYTATPTYNTTPTNYSNILGTPGNPLTFENLTGIGKNRNSTSPWYSTNNATPASSSPAPASTAPGNYAPNQPVTEEDIFSANVPSTQRLNTLQTSGYTVAYSPRIGAGDTRVPSMQAPQSSGLYGDVKTDELNEFKNRHKWYFDTHPNWNASNPNDVLDFQTNYDQEYAKQFGFSYFPGQRGFDKKDSKFGEYTYNAPGLNNNPPPTTGSTGTTPSGDMSGRKIENNKKIYTSTEYDNVLQNPYDKVRAMQASQYLNNVVSNKPYFTYAAAVNAPMTEAGRMSAQPLMDEAAKARYSANQLASKFGDSTQRMVAAAQQNEQINKAMFDVNKYNTEAEAQNRAQNLLRSSAAANTWNDRQKQAYDQNANVLDKMNYANAAYYNQYSAARQKDMLDEYYANRDLQTAYTPYLSTYETQNPDGTWTKHIAAPTYLDGRPNPNWNPMNTAATQSYLSKNDNESLTKTIQSLKDQGFNLDQISRMLGKQKLAE